jgi:hypothetical protein
MLNDIYLNCASVQEIGKEGGQEWQDDGQIKRIGKEYRGRGGEKYIVTCLSDSRRGFELDIKFIDH